MPATTIFLTDELFDWIERVKGNRTRSQVIRECISLYKEVCESKEKGTDVTLPGLEPLHIDKNTMKLLEDIAGAIDIKDLNEVLELVITGMHVLIKSELWKIVKPLPQLARELEESKSFNHSNHS